ncbi:MAG: ABC transporter permease [Paludibacteraceae bacterium]|nr:ABC transporter permease [Paludibacteraceae bacterium]
MAKLTNIFNNRRSWAAPYALFLVLFVVLPLIMIVFYAFHDASGTFTVHNFTKFFTTNTDLNRFIYSIGIAIITTLICILLGYPAAYIMASAEFNTPKVMAILFILPMWVNFLLRTIATAELFSMLGMPLREGALLFGMVYDFLPFMIYPIYNTIQKLDNSYLEAARDLGATPLQVFTKVTLPLSMPGIYSGIVMVFMPTVSTFAISEILTENNIHLFGTTIQESINSGTMLNYGAALSLIMLVIIGITSLIGNNDNSESREGGLL